MATSQELQRIQTGALQVTGWMGGDGYEESGVGWVITTSGLPASWEYILPGYPSGGIESVRYYRDTELTGPFWGLGSQFNESPESYAPGVQERYVDTVETLKNGGSLRDLWASFDISHPVWDDLTAAQARDAHPLIYRVETVFSAVPPDPPPPTTDVAFECVYLTMAKLSLRGWGVSDNLFTCSLGLSKAGQPFDDPDCEEDLHVFACERTSQITFEGVRVDGTGSITGTLVHLGDE